VYQTFTVLIIVSLFAIFCVALSELLHVAHDAMQNRRILFSSVRCIPVLPTDSVFIQQDFTTKIPHTLLVSLPANMFSPSLAT
jgi:hypothetical protein